MTCYFIYKSYSQGIKDDGQRYYLNKRVKEGISDEASPHGSRDLNQVRE